MRCFGGRLLAFILPLAILAAVVSACGAGSARRGKSTGGGSSRSAAATTPSPRATIAAAPPSLPADRTLLTLVSKTRGLSPPSSVPPDLVPVPPEFDSSAQVQQLRRPAAEALAQMLGDARNQGLGIKVASGYRSYEYQQAVLRSEIASYGCTQALMESAVPGHSEHQLGLAADLTAADVCWDLQPKFAQTPEGKWLAEHAASYGFVLSYPEGKEDITGYIYEPWHYRYVTPPVAQAIVASGKTPTEYLLSLGPDADSGVVRTSATVPSGYGCT